MKSKKASKNAQSNTRDPQTSLFCRVVDRGAQKDAAGPEVTPRQTEVAPEAPKMSKNVQKQCLWQIEIRASIGPKIEPKIGHKLGQARARNCS